ncbi:MAG: SWIM zinc finger family protein [Candidatus Eisenbacteria bacterium]
MPRRGGSGRRPPGRAVGPEPGMGGSSGGWRRPNAPRPVDGGIRAESRRGDFAGSWWARRWIEALEGSGVGARLTRGRSYARRGQVAEIRISRGVVNARVQGSRVQPYIVKIRVRALRAPEWSAVVDALGRKAAFAARLLAGEMPQEIEEAFHEAGSSLFPSRREDLRTECSCPDLVNPCKHIAAVFYLIGEEFDRDPFLIFRLRGMEREALLARIAGGGTRTVDAQAQQPPTPSLPAGSSPSPDSLPTDPRSFWGHLEDAPAESAMAVRPPRTPGAHVRRLGKFPFWRGKESLLGALEAVYRAASPVGLAVYLGEETESEIGRRQHDVDLDEEGEADGGLDGEDRPDPARPTTRRRRGA